MIVPMLISAYYAFTDFNILSPAVWTGLENFKTMFSDAKFWKSLGVTFYFAFVSVPLRLVFALIVALILLRTSRITALYRAAYYLPSIIGGSVAVAILWKRMFAIDGTVNVLLRTVGIESKLAWLGRTDTAIWTLIILAVWQFGSSMLIFASGLKQIPKDYYEAAEIDGAGAVKRFFKITLPILSPIILFNLIMQLISGFMTFTQAQIITDGGPNYATNYIALNIFKEGFSFQHMGYACAQSWVMLLIMAAVTGIIFKTSSHWTFYES
jgi:multiple sugar transport system permease protein